MKLKRIPSQSHETVEEKYQHMALHGDPGWAEIGEMMLHLVRYLQDHNIGTNVWVGTSLADLTFSCFYDRRGPYVEIYAMNGVYHIEYSDPLSDSDEKSTVFTDEATNVVEVAQKLQQIFSSWQCVDK